MQFISGKLRDCFRCDFRKRDFRDYIKEQLAGYGMNVRSEVHDSALVRVSARH